MAERAFPYRFKDGDEEFSGKGMTLRDYFAAKVLAGFSVIDNDSGPVLNWEWDNLARAAYKAADAMMQARKEMATPASTPVISPEEAERTRQRNLLTHAQTQATTTAANPPTARPGQAW